MSGYVSYCLREQTMISRRQAFYIIAGVIAFFLMAVRKKKYPEIHIWKMAVMMVWVTITGIVALKLLYFIENGRFGGDAWFGTVLFMPVFMIPMVKLKIPYKKVMNLYAPTQTLEFAIGKIDCYLSDCCMGKYLPAFEVQFPSQIADIAIGLIVTAVLLYIEHRKPKTNLYPLLMVIYGAARFAADWFRYVPRPWKWILPPTILWSLCSIGVGILWICYDRYTGQESGFGKR